jgi:hypothetical protein
MSLSRIREAIGFADSNKPRTEVNLYLAFGRPVSINYYDYHSVYYIYIILT